MKDEETKAGEGDTKETEREKKKEWGKKEVQLCRQRGCFSWLRKKRQKEKERKRKITNKYFLCSF